MKKYLSIFVTSFKQEKKTITNSLLAVISFAIIIYILNQLWSYIYGGSGIGERINGYTHSMMIWYMIGSEFMMYALNCRNVTKAFGNDIKSGKIAYLLNKPYNYYGYQISNQVAQFLWKLCFLIPAGVVMGLILLGPIDNFKFVYIFPILLTILLASLLSCMIYGLIGLLCFWIEDSTPFTWIVQKFVMLFGLFFPPEFFPSVLQNIITYSPVYAIMSGPSKLIANFSYNLFMEVAISQVCYILLSFGLGMIVYKLGTKRVNINGG